MVWDYEMIDTIIFDWGGVLIDDPAEGLVKYCSQSLGVTADALRETLDHYLIDFQRGILSERKMWQSVTKSLNVDTPKGSLWGEAFRNVYSPKEEIFSLARKLRNDGYKVGFLSNTEQPMMTFFFEQNYDMFHSKVFSCAEGFIKPEGRIYEIAIDRLDSEAAKTVFIDDKTSYVNGAEALGIKGILFHDPEQVRRELIKLGIDLTSPNP